MISWIHFGDLHIAEREEQNYGDFLTLFRRYLSPETYKSFTLGEQMEWLKNQLGPPAVVLMQAYPSEHGDDAIELRAMYRERGVLLVEMGHTHYNELANDGKTIYATTRSTGQLEEGPAGFSVKTLDHGVVSGNSSRWENGRLS